MIGEQNLKGDFEGCTGLTHFGGADTHHQIIVTRLAAEICGSAATKAAPIRRARPPPEELFEQCQSVRFAKASTHEFYPKHRTYLLRNIVYCADCVTAMPEDVQDDEYGKMRAHSNGGYNLYRCRARDFGRKCPQGSVGAEGLEEQVIQVLKTLKPPADWRDKMVQSKGDLLGHQRLEERV